MEHSKMFELVRALFEDGLWSERQVRRKVGVLITEEEYEEIVRGR